MKHSVKRFLSALMVLAMLLSMLSVVSFATGTTTTVYCKTVSTWTVCKAYWWGSTTGTNPSWPGVDMTQDDNGIWVYDVPSDAVGLIFTNGNGSQTSNLTVPTDSNVMYTYTTSSWGPYDTAEVEEAYYVAGSMNSWLNPDPDYKMNKQEDGTYALTLTLEAGNYELKVTDGTWDNSWGEAGSTANYKFAAAEAGEYVVTFDGSTVNVTGQLSDPEEMIISYITVAGSEGLLGVAWDPTAEAGLMTQQGSVYTLTLENVPAGEYEFKFVANGTWEHSWAYYGQVYSGGEYLLDYSSANVSNTLIEVVNEGATVTLTLDLTNMDYTTGLGAMCSVIIEGGEAPVIPEAAYYVAGSMNSWEPCDPAYKMVQQEDGTYALTLTLEAGSYELKVTDGTWDNCWGEAGGTDGNYVFTAATSGEYVVTFDGTTVNVIGDVIDGVPLPAINYITVVGSEGLTGAEWDVSSEVAMMTANGSVYTITFTGIAAGTYEYKFAANGGWDMNWASGIDAVSGEEQDAWFLPVGNSSLTVAEDNATVTLTLDLTNMDPITGEGGKTVALVEVPETTDPQVAIVDAAYALTEGESMTEAVTLTGVITSIDTPYSSTYKNITVTIAVAGCEDKPIWCYRLKGEGADTLAVGDTITVTGTLMNYYGTVEFKQGCTLDAVVKGEGEVIVAPEDPCEIVDAAYALEAGAVLPYEVTLTGTVTEIVTAYDETYSNISVNMVVEGREDKPILCYRLKGDGADTLAVGDIITITGTLKNYTKTDSETGITSSIIEFAAGCTLDAVVAVPQISGSVTWYHGDAPTVELWANGAVVYTAIVTDGTYTIRNVEAGTYTLKVSLDDHVTREYTVTVETEDVVLNVGIHLIGDANLDGKVNVGDVARAYAHVKNTSTITDEYNFSVVDVNGDGRVNVGDVSKIYAHAKETSLLFD